MLVWKPKTDLALSSASTIAGVAVGCDPLFGPPSLWFALAAISAIRTVLVYRKM